MPGENETTMAEDNIGGASEATGENEGGTRDSTSGAAGDDIGTSGASGTLGDVTDTVDHEGAVIHDETGFKVKRDSDGKIFSIEEDVVDEARARGVSFEDGTPVAFTVMPDLSTVLSVTERPKNEESRGGKGDNGSDVRKLERCCSCNSRCKRQQGAENKTSKDA